MESSYGIRESPESFGSNDMSFGFDFNEIERLILSHELCGPPGTLISTVSLINDNLTQAFDSFLLRLEIPDKLSKDIKSIEVEHEGIDRSKSWNKNGDSFEVKNSVHLVAMFDKLKKTVVEYVTNILDDRLVANRTTLINVKKKIVEHLYIFRESSNLHRNFLETSMTHRLSESVRLMKESYKKDLVEENHILSENTVSLQSTYDTLWMVQEDSREQLQLFEETILILNDNMQTSLETAASLRGNIIMMKERHEEQVEKLMRDALIKSVAKFESMSGRKIDSEGNSLAGSVCQELPADQTLTEVMERPACMECEILTGQVKELESALYASKCSLEISKNRIKRGSTESVKVGKPKTKYSKAAKAARNAAKGASVMNQSITSNGNDDEESASALLNTKFPSSRNLVRQSSKRFDTKRRPSTVPRTRNMSISSDISNASEASGDSFRGIGARRMSRADSVRKSNEHFQSESRDYVNNALDSQGGRGPNRRPLTYGNRAASLRSLIKSDSFGNDDTNRDINFSYEKAEQIRSLMDRFDVDYTHRDSLVRELTGI
jgi:hypothetical protein